MQICKVFHFETECQRFDAPKENVGDWLIQQFHEEVEEHATAHWTFDKSEMKKQDDGTHLFYVWMKELCSLS